MYLLSPLDLAAYALVPELIRAGVGALKIEGRLKSPEYVAVVTRHYRRAIDAAMAGRDPHFSQDEVRQLEAAFSRGFSHGWLEGDQPKKLVSGLSSAKRGTLLGKVTRVLGRRIEIALSSAVQRGDGVLFAGDGAEGEEQGGRVYQVYVDGRPAPGPVSSGLVELAPARGSMAWSKVRAGQTVWKTHDPELYRDLRRAVGQARRDRKTPLDLVVEAEAGQRLRIYGRTAAGARCQVESAEPLAEAVRHPLSEAMLAEQLGRLGATPYQLRGLEARIVGRPLAPLSVLGRLRREIIAQLDAASASPSREIAAEPQVARLRAALRGPDGGRDAPGTETPRLHVLCRSPEQLRAALDYGVRSLIAEYRDIADYRDAVRTARHGGAEISLATPRIQRPGETWVFQAIAAHGPDGVLVRNLAALDFFRDRGLPATADFSLNAANELTAQWLYERGACRVTPCHDVSRDRLKELVAAAPPGRLEVVVHLHVPMFHTQHCLFCAHLSAGNNRAECRRPCQHHVVRLEDRKGVQHLVAPDTLCRNTVYHAVPQSAAEIVLWLVARGVRHFRVELLDERGKRQVRRILEVYDELLAGHVPGREAWARLRALSPSGVTRGTLL